jgi:hypothetical protein
MRGTYRSWLHVRTWVITTKIHFSGSLSLMDHSNHIRGVLLEHWKRKGKMHGIIDWYNLAQFHGLWMLLAGARCSHGEVSS